MLRKTSWSPYLAGLIIGLLQIPAFLLISTGLGTSSSYVTTASLFWSGIGFDTAQWPYLAKYVSSTKYFWQLALVIGIILGAGISSFLSNTRRSGRAPIWSEFGMSNGAVRFFFAFCGGFILLLGARIAGGCTSGHGLTGVSQFAIGSTVTLVCLFVSGIVFAKLLRRS